MMVLLCAVVAQVLGSPALYAEKARSRKKDIESDIAIRLVRENEDKKGTDINDTYTVFVESPSGNTQHYIFVFSVNGREVKQIEGEHMPFSFKYNFRGLGPGTHELKVVAEDSQNYAAVTQATYTLQVKGKHKGVKKAGHNG